MLRSGYDYFVRTPGSVNECNCRVCGSIMTVHRNVNEPTSWASAIAKRNTLHDSFSCPHSEAGWHDKAASICMKIDETPSSYVKKLMIKEVRDLVKKNLGTDYIYNSEEEI